MVQHRGQVSRQNSFMPLTKPVVSVCFRRILGQQGNSPTAATPGWLLLEQSCNHLLQAQHDTANHSRVQLECCAVLLVLVLDLHKSCSLLAVLVCLQVPDVVPAGCRLGPLSNGLSSAHWTAASQLQQYVCHPRWHGIAAGSCCWPAFAFWMWRLPGSVCP